MHNGVARSGVEATRRISSSIVRLTSTHRSRLPLVAIVAFKAPIQKYLSFLFIFFLFFSVFFLRFFLCFLFVFFFFSTFVFFLFFIFLLFKQTLIISFFCFTHCLNCLLFCFPLFHFFIVIPHKLRFP